MKKISQTSSEQEKSVPSAAKTKAVVKPKAAATKSQSTPKAKPARATRKSSASSKVKAPAKTKQSTKQSPKDLLLNQDNDVTDLNTGKDYPTHPNRIWPD